jgi:hypothetical protein
VRVYLPEDERDSPVVVCSELPTNEGASVTNSAEQLAAEIIRYHRLPTPVVWIEHHPPIITDGFTETFDLVSFSSYEVRERGPYLGETRLMGGRPPGSASLGAWWRCSWAGRCRLRGQRPRLRDYGGGGCGGTRKTSEARDRRSRGGTGG